MSSLDPLAPTPPAPPLEPLDFTATFSFNKSLLAPLDQNAALGEDGTNARAAFSGTWYPSDSSVVWESAPRFIAALGNAESTSVLLERIEWNKGCPPDIALYNGAFQLDSLCREGETRLFSATGSLKLESGRPNPSGSRIGLRFELIESGETKLYVVDIKGGMRARLLDRSAQAGIYAADIDVSEWPQGTYIVVLETPTAQLSRMIQVSR